MERKQAGSQSVSPVRVEQFVCFNLAEEQYAVDIRAIQEVIKVSKITKVPQMPDFCLGVINSRGSIVAVFDLRRYFFLADKPFTDDTRLVLAFFDNMLVGFVVDRVLDNVKFDMESIDPVPTVKMKVDREYILGLGELEGRMIVILDVKRVHEHIVQTIATFVKS